MILFRQLAATRDQIRNRLFRDQALRAELDLFQEPVPTPGEVWDRLCRDHEGAGTREFSSA